MRPEGHVASRRAVKDADAALRTRGAAILDGSISGPPHPSAARTRLEDPTDRTWTHTSSRSLGGEVRMLLSFQRPPRPLAKVMPSPQRAPRSLPARDRPVSIAPDEGRAPRAHPGERLLPVGRIKIHRRARRAPAGVRSPTGPASAQAQAPEAAPPHLQDCAVQALGRE